MKVTAYRTHPVQVGENLLSILDRYLPRISNRQVVVVTSKIVSFCQGRVFRPNKTDSKQSLIEKEADLFISKDRSSYDVTLTVKNGIMIANSGIDESNGNGNWILWPKDPFGVAADIWHHIRQKHNLRHAGVLITDTHIVPMRWGTTGVAIGWCGFIPLKNYIGKPDIFGHKLRMTRASIIDGLASAADLVMGQGDEQTPIALVSDVPFIEFADKEPARAEIASLRIAINDDLYAPVLTSVQWEKGGAD